MQRVIVTVERDDGSETHDLEVPAEVEAEHLADLIVRALHWTGGPSGQPQRYQIEAHPPGRTLKDGETLASAGIWDGSRLILHPIGQGQRRTPRAAGGPLAGWRSLGDDLLPEPDRAAEPAGDRAPRPPGFAWKEIEE